MGIIIKFRTSNQSDQNLLFKILELIEKVE